MLLLLVRNSQAKVARLLRPCLFTQVSNGDSGDDLQTEHGH